MAYQFSAMHHQQQQQQQQPQQEVYSGQWTKEEQEYVACLMEGFKDGTLDIPDGTSLRFFIAAKLGCKPKRVSKKYERTGYNGKQVYRRDVSVAADKYRNRLQNCEAAFKKSRALVVSMQEAKGDSKPVPVVDPGYAGVGQAMEMRLIAMRSHIDQQATMLHRGYFPFSAAPLHPAAAPVSPDVLQAMMLQRRAAAAMAPGFGFPGLSSQPPSKLLVDLYKRRQQLIMNVMAAQHPPTMSPTTPPTASFALDAATPPKRTYDDCFDNDAAVFSPQSNKRARAA